MLAGGMLFLTRDATNEMHPILDKLSTVGVGERWSQPEMIKLRQFGGKAVPLLRRVLREKDKPTTRFLLWVKGKWPGVTKFYPSIPDLNKLTERRATACQVLQMLGPAGKSASADLIRILASKDGRDVNAASMALWAVGIDADVCDQIDEVLEEGTSGFGRSQLIVALANVKPPSARTLSALRKSLADSSPYIPNYAAETLGRLGAATPAVISGLKWLSNTSTDDLTVVTASTALWDLEKDSRSVNGRVFQLLSNQLQMPIKPPLGGGDGGQGVNATEQTFMKAAELFQKMEMSKTETTNALALLQSFCEKSGRIFVRMLLLPAMMDLGYPRQKCIEVCDAGLQKGEIYYRLQAAQLLVRVSDRFQGQGIDPEPLIHDQDVGVRVYACQIHWRKNKRASDVIPILTEALDRNKHQSYYYAEILPAALNTLGEIGMAADVAEQNIAVLTKDPNPSIAKLAAETLAKIHKQQ